MTKFLIGIRNIFLVSLPTLVFLLIIIEFFLQIINYPNPATSGWKYDGQDKNQLGFRGQKIEYSDDDIVILLLGDSQVQASGISGSLERMPEKLLQDGLNKLIAYTDKLSEKPGIKVFTIGCGGYGQDQQLLALEEYYENYRADMVVLWFTHNNDVWNNIFPTHWPADGKAKPTYWLENGILHGPSEDMGDIIYHDKVKVIALLNRVFIKQGLKNRPKEFLRDNEWEKYLPPAYEPLFSYNGEFSLLWQELRDNNNYSGSAFFKDENFTNEKTHFNMYLTPRSKRMQYGLDLTNALLNEIKKITNLNNGKFVVFNFDIPKEHIFNAAYNDGVYFLDGKYYEISLLQRNDNLAYIRKDFRYFSIPINMENWYIGQEDSHLNDNANEFLMSELSTLLYNEITPIKRNY